MLPHKIIRANLLFNAQCVHCTVTPGAGRPACDSKEELPTQKKSLLALMFQDVAMRPKGTPARSWAPERPLLVYHISFQISMIYWYCIYS